MKYEEIALTRTAPEPKVVECRLDMVDDSQIVIDADTPVFNQHGQRLELRLIPHVLSKGWIEMETVWEAFGEREPWQDEDDAPPIEKRSRARMRIYLHAVATAALVYEDEVP